MRTIDADALLEEFKVRAVSAKNWKENALNSGNEEAVIRADATLAFLTEVKLTIEDATTLEDTPVQRFWEQAYERGKADRPTGHWKDHRWCSNCGCGIPTDVYGGGITEEEAHFCVECGARMEAGNE